MTYMDYSPVKLITIKLYSPIKGKASEVGGIVSATSNRNTISDNKIVTPGRYTETVTSVGKNLHHSP